MKFQDYARRCKGNNKSAKIANIYVLKMARKSHMISFCLKYSFLSLEITQTFSFQPGIIKNLLI